MKRKTFYSLLALAVIFQVASDSIPLNIALLIAGGYGLVDAVKRWRND
jgi:hypothetical protein|nr:MAG TPA: hypothetical protein [Bacteriophage sp.]DAK52417.1 MAG TPA: hypothetical protein [Caudoviricetes sp.]